MEPLSNLLYLLEPASLALISTAVLVVLASAHRALVHEKESERHKDLLDSSITLSGRQALMIPLASSMSLLLMFFFFASVSQLITAFTALAAASSVIFALSPVTTHLMTLLGVGGVDPIVSRGCCGTVSRSQLLLGTTSTIIVLLWLVSGHWILNNLLGIAICVAFVSHVRLPNVKVCALLLGCLFLYDIFWVFYSERFFGANVMVTVATQQAHNPVHTVASTLHLPASQTIAKKLDLPVKLLFPRNLLRSSPDPITNSSSDSDGAERPPSLDYMMLGLGDMVHQPATLKPRWASFSGLRGQLPDQGPRLAACCATRLQEARAGTGPYQWTWSQIAAFLVLVDAGYSRHAPGSGALL